MLWARAGASGSSMDLRWGPHFFLKLAILLAGTYSGSSSHSMCYFVTSISEPGQQVPQFFYVGYVDDQEFVSYNTGTRRYLAKVPWISQVEKNDPKYWERNTLYAQGHEQSFRDHLATLAEYYNQSGGLHTFQWMYGCELRRDGSKGGYYQYAYDGRDYISLDKDTLTWMAADVPAQNTKRKWEADFSDNKYKKIYLEETCIEWLQRYLNYGKKTLLRTEVPEVKVTRKEDYDGMETLICRVGGFYPKDIDIDWTRDGEVWMQDVFHGLVSPNSDGTYYTWRSVTVDPKERERYKCHVEHDGLPNPVDVAWEEPASNLGLIIGCVVGVLFLMAVMAGIAVYFKKHHSGYKAAAASEQGSNSSGTGSAVPM
nr:PREDICTED: class I histocompatibility antigen, F10 alpha chain [Anolis carolinensis]|eukprot:XP_003229696.2 PREDICTED: class I histocompatibility antigen, F10 alpha chain [Anolis carolinensis]